MHIYMYVYIYNIMHTGGLEYVGIGTAGLVGEEQLPGRDPPEPSPLPAFPSSHG